MTAIVHQERPARSPLPLIGLAIPGLGHLVPWVGTAWYAARAAWVRRSVKGRRDAEARARVDTADDAYRAWFRAHGDHGDLWIGLNLFAHSALLVWSLVAGLPRVSAVLFSGPAGSLDTHAVIAAALAGADLIRSTISNAKSAMLIATADTRIHSLAPVCSRMRMWPRVIAA